ncbi:MAG: ribosome biogenesis GTPase YlqF, partial [Moorea sp. SIO3G5]|nr:ribosome biogenesis GTPase YlqF [Moorena sp. SIO3G5]
LELLDAPGVIPVKLNNQQQALKLAICDDIGEASYDNQRVATALVAFLKDLDNMKEYTLLLKSSLEKRYQLDPNPLTAEDYLHALADYRYQGNIERTARQLLGDFRKGLLGAIALEVPPGVLP